jgi:hypothetical protein
MPSPTALPPLPPFILGSLCLRLLVRPLNRIVNLSLSVCLSVCMYVCMSPAGRWSVRFAAVRLNMAHGRPREGTPASG